MTTFEAGPFETTGNFCESVTISVKANLSNLHLKSAKLFADQCLSIEGEESEKEWPQPRKDELYSYSSATVIIAVSFLEAFINEFYLKAIDKSQALLTLISEKDMAQLSILWNEAERFKILNKYQLALTVCDKEKFDIGKKTYQSADNLIKLRNQLVHFKPEWDNIEKEHKKLENNLKNKFPENSLWKKAPGHRAWFPNKCLGGGCANWAYTTVCNFSNEFTKKLNS
jgi:hypothetical protein